MLIFVDCEAHGACPATGRLTWFGAVAYQHPLGTAPTFEGVLIKSRTVAAVPDTIEVLSPEEYFTRMVKVFVRFERWLEERGPGRHVLVSDNPAFDWQWINDGFHRSVAHNPFGHSARRIGDFYAGLRGDFHATQQWKKLRVTKHDHNPVNDALGNAEAFDRMRKGER